MGKKRLILTTILTILMTVLANPLWFNARIYEQFKKLGSEIWRGADVYFLVIVLILAFLLSYKLVQYISRFKLEEHTSRIDIVFVCCFFVLLCIPMSKIKQGPSDMIEKRMLATYQPIVKDGKINTEYGKQFEAWFNDRFNGRKKLIWLNKLIQLYSFPQIYQNNKAVYLRKSGWMFDSSLYVVTPNKDQTQKIIENIKKLEKWCSDRNIKFYLLIVPYKNEVYSEYLAPLKYDAQQTIPYKQFIKHLQNEIGNGIVLYPYEELLQAKAQDFIFFKETHHWTDWGAFIGYQQLMKRITQDFPDISTVSLEDYKKHTSTFIRDEYPRNYHTGYTTSLLGISPDFATKYILKDEYTYYDHKDEKSLKEQRGQYIKEFNYPKGKYRILLTGTSQNEDLLQFLPYSAQQIKYIRLNRGQLSSVEERKIMKHYQKDIDDFHPDMMIITIQSYSHIFYLLDIWKE